MCAVGPKWLPRVGLVSNAGGHDNIPHTRSSPSTRRGAGVQGARYLPSWRWRWGAGAHSHTQLSGHSTSSAREQPTESSDDGEVYSILRECVRSGTSCVYRVAMSRDREPPGKTVCPGTVSRAARWCVILITASSVRLYYPLG